MGFYIRRTQSEPKESRGLLSEASVAPAAAPAAAPVAAQVAAPVSAPVAPPVAAPAAQPAAQGATWNPAFTSIVLPAGMDASSQAAADWVNANRGAAPTADSYWVPAALADNSAYAEFGPVVTRPTGGFWNQPDKDGSGWGAQLSSGLKDFMASPVALPILAMATAGTGLAANLGTSLGATGNAATALRNGLITGGTTLASGGSVEDALKNGLLSGGLSYGGAALSDAVASPVADIAGPPIEASDAFMGAPSWAGGSAADVGPPAWAGGAADAVGAPAWAGGAADAVGPPAWSGGAVDAVTVPDLASMASATTPLEVGPPSWAGGPVDAVGPPADLAPNFMGPPAGLEDPVRVTPTVQPVQSSVQPDPTPIQAAPVSSEGQKTIGNTPNVGGGLLDTVKTTGSDIASWMRDNPTLGRLLLSGAGALLNTVGSGASTGGGTVSYGAPVQWNSNPSALNQSLLSGGLLGQGVKQLTPQLPTGLLGNAHSGAWRYMKG